MDPTGAPTIFPGGPVRHIPSQTRKRQTQEDGVGGSCKPQASLFERRHLVDQVKGHFSSASAYHGILNERVMLWGASGCGKRHIAAQAASEIAESDGRKVLWVEGRSFEGFVQDFRTAYQTLTGVALPYGLSCSSSLSKVKDTLEQRRQEWLLVVFDLQYFLEDNDDGASQALITFFPDRGQILMTSSCITLGLEEMEGKKPPSILCGLEIAGTAVEICVPELSDHELQSYNSHSSPGLASSRRNVFGKFQRSEYATPLFLSLTSANMKLLGLVPSQYSRVFRHEVAAGPRDNKRPSTASHFAMKILWEGIADHNQWSLHLLAAMSVVDRLQVPLALVKKLPTFERDINDGLTVALELLVSLDILKLGQCNDGLTTLNLPLIVYRWIRGKVRDTYEKSEYERLFTEWVEVLDKHLVVAQCSTERAYDAKKGWTLAPHIWSLVSGISLQSISSPLILTFLVNIGSFLVNDRLLPNYAGIFSSHAYGMYLGLRLTNLGISSTLDHQFIQIKLIRAKAYLQVLKPLLAQSDLADAKSALAGLPRDADSARLTRELRDLEIQVCLARECYAEATRILDTVLDSPEACVKAATIAQRHFWMAKALKGEDYDVAAIQHSHAVMSYWRNLPEAEQWGMPDVGVLHWVDKHASLLMSLQKFKGALLFLPRLLETWVDLAPKGSSLISRLAFFTTLCYGQLDKVSEAERVACRLFEWCPVDEMEGESLTFALLTLHEIGIQYEMHGRTVEAEGVFRFNLLTARDRDVSNLLGSHKYELSPDWLQLVVCLLRQGKNDEARRVRDEYQDEEHNEDFTYVYTTAAMRSYHDMRDIYERSFWAEQDGNSTEFRALLDPESGRQLLKRAVRRFGSVKRRVREGRDLSSDVDLHHVSLARKSRMLRLLDRSLVYLSFANRLVENEADRREEMWLNRSQHVLGEFWRWCDCRKRRPRSASINPVDLIEKQHIRAIAEKEMRPKRMKQKLITDWITVEKLKPQFVKDCNPECPCLAGNKTAEAEYAVLESTLWTWKEPSRSPIDSKKPNSRYRKPPRNRSHLPDNELFAREDGQWTWLQRELMYGEGEDENYIIPHARHIPTVTITPPEGSDEIMKILKDGQDEITKFYKVDYEHRIRFEKYEDLRKMRRTRLDDILEDDEEF